MPDVQDLSLAIKNLEIEYRQSLVFSYEGRTFVASPETILWIDRQLALKPNNDNRAYDHRGMPVHIRNLNTLRRLMHERLREADKKFIAAETDLRLQLVAAYTPIPEVPEHEE